MSRKNENTAFVCENCNNHVTPISSGSIRNHCPYCLHSKHLDILPGDRQSDCMGVMVPIGQRLHSKKGIQLVHQCELCGHISTNRIDDGYSGDDYDRILRLPAM